VLSQVQPGSIVISHDGGGPRGQTLAAYPTIIAALRARGYRIVTIPELLGLRPVYVPCIRLCDGLGVTRAELPRDALHGYARFGFPAASPDVIDVGGTTLKLTQSNGVYSWAGETTWSGSGSGCSLYFSAQAWQASAAGWSATGCGAARGVADVAADADPNTGAAVYDTTKYNGRSGWFQVGGTSLASPLVAAVYALAGNAASVEYPATISYTHTASLHDVTAGPATGSCTTTACKAGPGYDGPTGVGTPNAIGGF
jgi:hypothetical protein